MDHDPFYDPMSMRYRFTLLNAKYNDLTPFQVQYALKFKAANRGFHENEEMKILLQQLPVIRLGLAYVNQIKNHTQDTWQAHI